VSDNVASDGPEKQKLSISAVLLPVAWVTASTVAMVGWMYGISRVAWKLFEWSGFI
jgi:hypothetical protein